MLPSNVMDAAMTRPVADVSPAAPVPGHQRKHALAAAVLMALVAVAGWIQPARALVSIDVMRAWANGLRTISMCSMPGSTMSST